MLQSGDARTAREIADGLAQASGEGSPWSVRAAVAVLDGLVLMEEGDVAVGLARLREGAAIEAEAPLTFGPPSPVTPASEALGAALESIGETEDAMRAYEAVLTRAPNRRQATERLRVLREPKHRM